MKRRLLSAFLAVMMVLTMAPVAFAADEGGTTGVAKIGDVEYPTLQAAVDVANNGDTIVLKKSISATEIGEKKQLQFVKADMNVTLDLNQNTITAEAGEAIAINAANITLTVKNGTIENFAEGNYSDGVYAYKESNNLTLTFENIVLKSRTQGLAVQGLTSNSNVNIVNSKITSAEELGIYYPPKSGTLTISDSEITGVTGIVVKGSNLVVKGEKTIISGTGPNVDPETYYTGATDGSSTLTETGDALYIESGYNDRDISVSISGGHLNSKSAKAVRMFVKNGENTSAKREISVTGGTFSSDVSAYVAEGYVQNENGTVEQLGETNAVAKIDDTYYKTLAEAVAAAKDGDTVKLLKNVTSANILKINQSITLDLGDYTFELTGSGNTARAIYINDGANVTIKANEKGGVKAATIALQVNAGGKLTIESGTYTGMYALALFSSDTKPAEAILNNGVFNGYIYTNGTGHDDHITFNGGTYNEQVYLASGDKSTYTISNGTFKNSLEIDAGRLDISGGTFTANIDTSGNANHPVTNNNGSGAYVGTLVVCKPDGSSATGYIGDAVVNITGGTFENTFANGETIVVADFGKEQENVGDAKVTISDNAKIKGVVKAYASENNTGMNFSITGGYFTTDPSDYVASGYVAGTSDVSGYSYKVVAKTDTGNVEVKPAVSAPEVKVSESISKEDKAKVEEAAKTVSAPTLGAETGDIVKDINEDTAKALIKKATTVPGDNKKLYVQSSLKVEPTAYDAANKTLALEITPQYRVVASTADTADKIKLDGDTNTKNAQVVQDYQTMNITKATVVTMELPTGFAVADGDKLSIQHTKSNDKVEYYTGTVTKKDDKLYLTFTTNGFSPFVISVPEAAIESKVYPTLQAAVDSAKNDDIIDLYKDVAPDTKVTVAKTIKFKIATNSKKFDAAKNIVAGSNTTVKVTGESSPYIYEFTYTKPSSGSSGGSSSGKTTYKVTTSAVNNGGVNASPSNAEKGATITLTLSPDKGYKLDKLTVTDGSGKSVSTVKKSDTVYTFTMPASAVTVGVSYAKADETPSKTTFNDVSANDWFASAVDYVTGKGMMNGTAANTFSPKANTTRGMLMTVLARHAGEDTTGGSVWYEKGMNWAKANGVSDGTNPQVNITREQLAAMLYRYAQNKKYDVSGAKSLDGYTDAQSVSSYAVPALQWANAAGVVNGKSGSKLDPKGYATRAEVAAMLMRFCENVEK